MFAANHSIVRKLSHSTRSSVTVFWPMSNLLPESMFFFLKMLNDVCVIIANLCVYVFVFMCVCVCVCVCAVIFHTKRRVLRSFKRADSINV